MIYRFVTRDSVEERITQVAKKKMMLTHLVVRPGAGRGTNMSKKELDDILRFGTEDLFKDDEEMTGNAEGGVGGGGGEGGGAKIHYDDQAIEKLLDRSQEGIQEKEDGLNEYLSSFKVASYATRETNDEDEEEFFEPVQPPTTVDENLDPYYWDKLLRAQYEQYRELESHAYGKGKRTKRHVNYITSTNDDNLNEHNSDNTSDYDAPSASGLGENEDGDFDEISDRKRRTGRDRPLPPLINKSGSNIEILGFNLRQRKAFHNAIMRFGMPPPDSFKSQWLVRDLRGKSEKEFRAYVSLFMKHLCEQFSDNTETFSDGVPREGLSRHHVLSRIGIMSLLRKKVQEFEQINGPWSIPEQAPRETPEDPAPATIVKVESSASVVSAENPPTVPPSESNETVAEGSTENLIGESMSLSDLINVKTEIQTDVEMTETNEEKKTTGKYSLSWSFVSSLSFSLVDEKPEIAKTTTNPAIGASTSRKPAPIRSEKLKDFKFMFNIADGGFTELHALWLNEQRALTINHEHDIWHRRHDYWLLAGIVAHGYSRWQDIQSDPRFSIINQPFKLDMGKGNFLEMKNKFLARRFKLLEQALVIEEQLRRAAFLGLAMEQTNPALTLSQRFSEVECLAECHQHLSKESLAGNKPANVVLIKVLTQLEELLSDMKQEVNKLPANLAGLPAVSQRLRMSERSILSRLPNGQNQPSTTHETNDAYTNYPHHIGPFALPTVNGTGRNKSGKDRHSEFIQRTLLSSFF